MVVVEGGLEWGKAWLATNLGDDAPALRAHVTLTDPAIAEQAAANPDALVRSLRRPMLIEEVQLDHGLLLAAERLAAETADPGQILVTSSARREPHVLDRADPPAGPVIRLSLSPMTVGERTGEPLRSYVSALFDDNLVAGAGDRLSSGELIRLMVRGGIPRAPGVLSAAAPSATRDFLDGYPPRVIPRLPGTSGIDQARLLQTFWHLASAPYQILNASSAANDLGISRDTFARYRDLLEASFLLRGVPALGDTSGRAATAHPRMCPTDTALACRAAGLTLTRELDPIAFGRVLETFVANELHAQTAWGGEGVEVRHWRDTARRKEVDLVLVHPDGRLVGIEVTSAGDARSRDTRSLRALAEAVPQAYHRGLVLHTGERRHQIGDREWAVPLTDLWNTLPSTTPRSTTMPRIASPPLSGDAAGAVFISYTHDDDAADGGRIVALARGLATRLQVKNSSLQVFLDRDLRWGEVWRQRIDQQLARTTMFVPFVTPLFLRSPECRRELEAFLSTADATDQKGNLLPIIWRSVSGSWKDDPLTARIPERQWENWSDLVYEDPTSGPALRALDAAADRLIEIATELQPSTTPDAIDGAVADGSEIEPADAGDLLEVLEEFEPANQAFTEAMGDFQSTFESWGDSFAQNSAALSTITSGSSPSQVRSALKRLGQTMQGPTDEVADATRALVARRDKVDALVSTLLRRASAGEVPHEVAEPLREELAALPSDMGIDPSEVDELRQTVGMLGTFSRDLQPIASTLDQAIIELVDTGAMLERWKRQVDQS